MECVRIKTILQRNSYTKAKKTQSSGIARKTLSKHSKLLLEKLQFLAPYVTAQPTLTNMDEVRFSSNLLSNQKDIIRDSQHKMYIVRSVKTWWREGGNWLWATRHIYLETIQWRLMTAISLNCIWWSTNIITDWPCHAVMALPQSLNWSTQ